MRHLINYLAVITGDADIFNLVFVEIAIFRQNETLIRQDEGFVLARISERCEGERQAARSAFDKQ